MSKLIVCFLSICLISCNIENETKILRKAVQSSDLQTLQNIDSLLLIASLGNSTKSKVVKSVNFKKIDKNIL